MALKKPDLLQIPVNVKSKRSVISTVITVCLAIGSSVGLIGCFHPDKPLHSKSNSVHQYSTLSALLEGVYDGEMTIGELKLEGNFGIGTFNALDGELILLEGQCYKAASDSRILTMADSVKTPFAAICNFRADTTIRINQPIRIKALENYLDSATLILSPGEVLAAQTGDGMILNTPIPAEENADCLINALRFDSMVRYLLSNFKK